MNRRWRTGRRVRHTTRGLMDAKPAIELREITMENFRECIDLSVAEHQRGFVASNMYSLAEAKADGVSNPLAIYADGQMVGFTMYCFDPEKGTGCIDRLMVAVDHQGRGYGRAAMTEVMRRLRETPGCRRIRTAYEPSNAVAEKLYESLGFRKTGAMCDGETVTVIELSEPDEVTIRELRREEVQGVWSVDRSEVIDAVYYHQGGELVLRPEHYDMKGWPPGEAEHYGPILLDCYDRGGTFYGAFDGHGLVGAAVLESRFIGRERDQLQLKFLHVGRSHRGSGLGRTLFHKAVARARERGARRLYISSTPSENSVGFYLGLGCRLTKEVDPELFELEPGDIHMEFDIPAAA